MVKRLIFLFAFTLPLFCSAQDAVRDSLVQDSLDKAFSKQVKANEAAKDIDTVRRVKAEIEDSLRVDTLPQARKNRRHSPTKAALFSAALPGLGQGYNKKYWKIPIVYAGLGGLGYAVYYTASKFTQFRAAYRLQVDEDPNTYGSYGDIDDAPTLKAYRDYYKRYLDIAAICTGIWYVLNIVDAAVDAHLFEWNMKDDINVSWQPSLVTPGYAGARAGLGLQLQMHF